MHSFDHPHHSKDRTNNPSFRHEKQYLGISVRQDIQVILSEQIHFKWELKAKKENDVQHLNLREWAWIKPFLWSFQKMPSGWLFHVPLKKNICARFFVGNPGYQLPEFKNKTENVKAWHPLFELSCYMVYAFSLSHNF